MNVRLRKTFAWSSAIIYDGQFLINNYEAHLDMISVSADARDQNIAYERAKAWIHEVLNGAVLMEDQDPGIETWTNTGARILLLPEKPVDQVIGLMLYSKLNAVMEGRLLVTDLEISSVIGEGMSYLHSGDEELGPLSARGWWQDARPGWSNQPSKTGGKVVTLDRQQEWKDLELDWPDSTDSTHDRVVVANFTRDEH